MTDLQIEIREIKATLKSMQEDIKRLEQQQQPFPFGTWKEYPPTQGAPQAYTDQMTPSYHCTYEHP